MSSNYHTPWVDDTTEFKTAHMNVPLGELDAQITINTNKIATLVAGKFMMVNEAGTAFIYKDIVTSGGNVVVAAGQVVVN